MTYDGQTWRLYLDGVLDGTADCCHRPSSPANDSIQHAAIAAALDSTGAGVNGVFNGVIDEVRIWDRALSLAEIQANVNQQITSAPNLVARWGFNESGAATTVNDSTPGPVNGTITGSAWTRTAGAPFNLVINQAPSQPVLERARERSDWPADIAELRVNVSDPDSNPMYGDLLRPIGVHWFVAPTSRCGPARYAALRPTTRPRR